MQTFLLIGCYLPIGFIPIFLPAGLIRSIEPYFRWLSFVPPAVTILLWVFFSPLTILLGYTISLLPAMISFASLFIALIGLRLIRQARRENKSYKVLAVETLISALPFIVVAPFLGYAIVLSIMAVFGA
jgi:hypothetical protein